MNCPIQLKVAELSRQTFVEILIERGVCKGLVIRISFRICSFDGVSKAFNRCVH